MRLLLLLLAVTALSYSSPKVKEYCNSKGCVVTAHEDDNTGQQIEGTNIWIGNEFAANNKDWLKEASIRTLSLPSASLARGESKASLT
jgi:hypothetical protein